MVCIWGGKCCKRQFICFQHFFGDGFSGFVSLRVIEYVFRSYRFLGGSIKVVTIYNFSEGQEDVFCISIGNQEKTNLLVDGGNGRVDFITKMKELDIQELHYVLLTHIDQDHIKGVINMCKNKEYCKDITVIYNRFTNGVISYRQAEQFEELTKYFHNVVSYKEYQDSLGSIIFLSTSQRKKIEKEKDQIYITFLSPQKEKVQKLYEYYDYYKSNNKCKTGNAKIVNQSSIIFILEYNNYVVLMMGDGYIEDIIEAINSLSDTEKTNNPITKFDMIKIPHHGSEDNNRQLDKLLGKLPCDKFIITNKFVALKQGDVQIKEELIENLCGKTVYSSSYEKEYEYKGKKLTITKENVIKL